MGDPGELTAGTINAAGTAAGEATPGAQAALEGWDAIRARQDIQFAPIEMPKQDPPEASWLGRFIEGLADLLSPLVQALGISWPVFQWILIGIGAALLALLLWRLLLPIARIRLARTDGEAEPGLEAEWAPDRVEAVALLDEADRLAAEGRFDEATHLLLKRSVGQIATARPDWLEPSSTAREIAALPALPDRARTAFATIADRVERSLFALRRLDLDDWQAARTAYADFALTDLARTHTA